PDQLIYYLLRSLPTFINSLSPIRNFFILKVASGEANENYLYTWIKKPPSLILQHSEEFLEYAKLYFVRLVKVADIKHHNSITSLQLFHSSNAQRSEHIHLGLMLGYITQKAKVSEHRRKSFIVSKSYETRTNIFLTLFPT
ncbi:hypothetical protein, partial [Gardnerella vaginalis]|uniref:hypothetical protein n=1 Tax=Gardnerella vaginalis TaxID=2702 RepID=UPI000518742D